MEEVVNFTAPPERVWRGYLPQKLLGQQLQVLQAEQGLLQGSLSLVFGSLQQNPTLLDVAEGFTFTRSENGDQNSSDVEFI